MVYVPMFSKKSTLPPQSAKNMFVSYMYVCMLLLLTISNSGLLSVLVIHTV